MKVKFIYRPNIGSKKFTNNPRNFLLDGAIYEVVSIFPYIENGELVQVNYVLKEIKGEFNMDYFQKVEELK